jgi:hypothetical protein
MWKNSILVVVALLLLAAPASAQFITDITAFPVVARDAGMHGTQWVTDLTVFNPMDHEVSVVMVYYPSEQIGEEHMETLDLDPGETILIEDVVSTGFGFVTSKGMLSLNVSPDFGVNPEGTVVHAVSRTYNTGGGEGTYGQTIPSAFAAVNVGRSSSFVTGARNDDAFRSNLGIAAASLDIPLRVHYRIISSDGTVLVEASKVLPAAGMNQWSFDRLGVGLVEGPLTVELWLDPDDATEDPCAIMFPNGFFAYVSKVDNLTGDAEYLEAVPMDPYMCELYD